MSAPNYRRDSASAFQLADLLRRCDAAFVPPLSSRVDIDAYAAKIAANAVRFEAWDGGALVALLAAYCNDTAAGVAYVTSVSVAPELARRGIAGALLAECIRHARAAGMRQLALEVDAANTPALRLYRQHGFTDGPPAAAGRMTLNLINEDDHD